MRLTVRRISCASACQAYIKKVSAIIALTSDIKPTLTFSHLFDCCIGSHNAVVPGAIRFVLSRKKAVLLS